MLIILEHTAIEGWYWLAGQEEIEKKSPYGLKRNKK